MKCTTDANTHYQHHAHATANQANKTAKARRFFDYVWMQLAFQRLFSKYDKHGVGSVC